MLFASLLFSGSLQYIKFVKYEDGQAGIDSVTFVFCASSSRFEQLVGDSLHKERND